MKDVSIIVVNYNTKDFLIACLESITESISKKLTYEVIVVDNASQDDSVSAVRNIKNPPNSLILIPEKVNVGFSKANNIGVKMAKGKYILFLNADTVFRENVLEEMVDFMEEHTKAGAATCILRMPNGKIDDAIHRGFPTPWNAFSYFSGIAKIFPNSIFFNGYNLGWRDMDKVHEIDALAGAFMLVRREAGEEVGWWDEDYFFYGEDLDFCYKLKQRNWKIYFVPDVEILHYKGVSGGIKKESQHITKASKETRMLVTNARFEAMKIFYKKHYTKKYPGIVTFLVFKAIDVKKRAALRNL